MGEITVASMNAAHELNREQVPAAGDLGPLSHAAHKLDQDGPRASDWSNASSN